VPTLCFGTRNLDIAVGTADTVWVWGAQLEAVSGAANQAPGDYVSCGVLAAPYHGNGVDGVQYFGTTNGNSVAANIVTEAAGTAIPAANLLGYVAENQATNLCLQSQTFDNAAWTKSGAAIVADNFSAPDGSQTADRFTDDATNAFHRIIQNAGMTIVSGTVYTYSVYAKAGSLTWLQLATAVGTVRWANFNLVTGALGNKEAGTTAKIEALPVGWYRCSITWTADNTSVIPIIYSLGSDVAGTGGSYIGSSQNMFVWGAQVEQASDASSYVSTTTASVTRNEDNLRYPMLSNLDGATGTTYAESYFPGAWLGKQAVVLAHSANNGYSQYYEIPKTFGIYPPPSAQFLTANARTVGAVNKSTTAWSGASASACLNGGAVATGAYGAYPNSGNVIVGGAGYATVQGSIRNVRFYATRLTDVQLQALTT
jgi:hypothetical protein